LECGITLDILAVFVKRRSANALQFATGQRRFQNIRSIDRTFSGTSTNECMNFINEDDTIAAITNFLNNLLQALFELTTVLGTCNQGADIESQQAFTGQSLRYFA